MRLRREIKRYIELELRDFHQTLKDIGDERNELILASSCGDDSGIRGTDTTDPTAQKAFKLLTNKRIKRMEDTCKAINNVLEELQGEKYRLIVLKFWTRPQVLTDEGIARELNCDRRTLYRWLDCIILSIGREMGIVD